MDHPVLSLGRKLISLILKLVVVVSAAFGVYLSATDGIFAFMSGKRVFMYFTIQSNIAIALICAFGAVLLFVKRRVKNWWFVVKFVGTVAITLTGGVFSFVLAPTLGDMAWNIRNVLTHVIVPLCAIADVFVTGVFGDLKKSHIPYATVPPLLYVIYAAVAYVQGWEFAPGKNYPYFFLNWGSEAGAFGFSDKLPFMGCVWWLIAGALLICGIGLLYIVIINKLKRRRLIRA
jgi:hypothetical protein